MKKPLSILLVITSFIFCLNLYGQKKDTTGQSQKKDSINRKNDSLNTIILQQFNKRQQEIEQLRIADSITRSNLEKEINSLKTTDKKKQELEKQLQDLRNNEALRFAEKKKQIDSLRLTAKAYPVLGLFNDTLFNIYNRSGSFTAEERAEAIQNRIKKLTEIFRFAPDSIQLMPSETTTDLNFKDNIIISISDDDALWNNTTRNDLAEKYREIIGDEVVKYKEATSFRTLAKEIGLALLIIFIVIILIKYMRKFFRWLRMKIIQQTKR